MSESVSDEEDFKLPLRPWLKNHIDKKTFPGLDWLNQEQLIFKIPWTKKNHPGWEKDYEVFKAWAKHRGRFSDQNPIDYNKLKGNFRSVLHKSEDFLELKQESKTEQQTGNYRVFQILPSSKVKANRKRSCSKSQEAPEPSPVVSKQKKPSLVPATSTPLPQSSQEPVNVPAVQQQIEFRSYTDEDIIRELELHSPNQGYTVDVTVSPLTGSSVAEPLPSFSIDDLQFLDTSENSVQVGENLLHQSNQVMLELQHAPTLLSPKLKEFLEHTKASDEQLTKYFVTVYYGEAIVVCQKLFDFSLGLRILYGNAELQARALAANGRNVEELNFSAWELPAYEKSNKKIVNNLKYAELGVVLQANKLGQLFAKRLCQSRVWHLEDKNKPVRLLRMSNTQIYSYTKYIEGLENNQSDAPSWKIELTIGEKPPTPLVNIVKIVLEPFLAPFVEDFFVNSNNGSLCYSNDPSSIDDVIRLFTMQSIEK